MRTIVTVVAIAFLSLASAGELSVLAMGAPTELPHSQAHVMGFMCKGGGRGPSLDRSPEATVAPADSAYRIQDSVTGRYFSQDPMIGVLEYLNRLDCEASARTLNRRFGSKARYACVLIKK